jgi:hypothetical protein
MSDPALILHIGAPKCGSSALQTALTAQPDVMTADGRRLRYAILRQIGARYRHVQGGMLSRAAALSPYGYLSCPNFGRTVDADALIAALSSVFRSGQEGGWVPVLSCEGWINHPGQFARLLEGLGYPPVQVIAFLRPPVEWVNAAWWQWGVWSFPHVAAWQKRGLLTYRFADDLELWQQIPNVRLDIRRARPDVVQKFSDLTAAPLHDHPQSNASPPASLIGFLLRNRRFRPTPHDARAEFVFQRWCPPVAGEPGGLWALNPQQIRDLRPVTSGNMRVLRRLLTDEAQQDVFADPGWRDETTYHPVLKRGLSRPHALEALPTLHAALVAGVSAAEKRAVATVAPDADAPVEVWDRALAALFERLLAADAQARQGGLVGRALSWTESWLPGAERR